MDIVIECDRCRGGLFRSFSFRFAHGIAMFGGLCNLEGELHNIRNVTKNKINLLLLGAPTMLDLHRW